MNFMDYGVRLGRRPALKLDGDGAHGLDRRAVIRDHVQYAERLAASSASVDIRAARHVVQRRGVSQVDPTRPRRKNADLLERMNASGRLFVSHTS